MKINRKQAQKVLNLSYPDYKGRKIYLEFKTSLKLYNCNWSGGTKNEYKFLKLKESGTELLPIDTGFKAPWNNAFEAQIVNIPVNCAIVKHCYFCGNDCGITIYINNEKSIPELENKENSLLEN